MQTFVPYPEFARSAACLDRARLGKQRIETKQLIKSLTEPNYGWKNHPASKMWKGCVPALAQYGIAICDEWIRRGYVDNQRPWFETVFENRGSRFDYSLPSWWGKEIHATHRAALLYKAPDWYAQFQWTEKPELNYHWPA